MFILTKHPPPTKYPSISGKTPQFIWCLLWRRVWSFVLLSWGCETFDEDGPKCSRICSHAINRPQQTKKKRVNYINSLSWRMCVTCDVWFSTSVKCFESDKHFNEYREWDAVKYFLLCFYIVGRACKCVANLYWDQTCVWCLKLYFVIAEKYNEW